MSTGDVNSSNMFSSEPDVSHDSNSVYMEIPFHDCERSTSSEVGHNDLGFNPFHESPVKLIKKKESCWSIVTKDKNDAAKKTMSLPLLSKRHLIDFWQDFGNGEICSLPTLGAGKSDSIQRISSKTVFDLLSGEYNMDFCIVDCRFGYEYKGGHIRDAINISSNNEAFRLFDNPKIVIFHCEYSSVRAPKVAQYVRNLDRNVNTYPNLTLPEIYILEGGYKGFYFEYPDMCTPRGYIPMDDGKYKEDYNLELSKISKNKRL